MRVRKNPQGCGKHEKVERIICETKYALSAASPALSGPDYFDEEAKCYSRLF